MDSVDECMNDTTAGAHIASMHVVSEKLVLREMELLGTKKPQDD